MSYENRAQAGSFGEDPLQYDRSRPSYPEALVDDLLTDGAADVVDVGCGTGIVARLLGARGSRVVGVEADERMAVVARGHGVEVETSRFEEWDAAGRTFDLLTSGQAWHWVRPDDGVAKAAEVLHPGGRFAAFWNHPQHRPETMAAFLPIYERHAPHIIEGNVALGTVTPRRDDNDPDVDALARNGSFAQIKRRQYAWVHEYSRDAWLDELVTHSSHRTLDPGVLATIVRELGDAIDTLGGRFVSDYVTNALFAERI